VHLHIEGRRGARSIQHKTRRTLLPPPCQFRRRVPAPHRPRAEGLMMNLQLPHIRKSALAVWRRNVLVWRRLIGPSVAVNLGEPLLYLLGLGYGLGMFIGKMAGMDYLTFVASGIIASSAMSTATFEGMYSV